MRNRIDLSPTKWLKSLATVNNAARVLATFDAAHPIEVVRFRGPHSFFRVAGWDETIGRLANAYGRWWIDEAALISIHSRAERLEMFKGWLPDHLVQEITALPVHYRALTAVCNNWNDFREQFKFVLPVGEEVVGLTGTAALQPLADTMDRRSRTVPWLPGGAEQVYLPGPINPLSVYKVNLW